MRSKGLAVGRQHSSETACWRQRGRPTGALHKLYEPAGLMPPIQSNFHLAAFHTGLSCWHWLKMTLCSGAESAGGWGGAGRSLRAPLGA